MTQLVNFVSSLSNTFPKMTEKGRNMQKSCYVIVYFCTYLLCSNWNEHCKIMLLHGIWIILNLCIRVTSCSEI